MPGAVGRVKAARARVSVELGDEMAGCAEPACVTAACDAPMAGVLHIIASFDLK